MFAISGQRRCIPGAQRGHTRWTHGGHTVDTHESGADDGRGLNPETCFARKHLSSKTRWLRNALAASTGFCPGMSNLCPSPHRLPVLTDSRFLTPQSGFPPHNARNLPEKRSRCYPASDPDIIRWRRYSEVFIIGETGKGECVLSMQQSESRWVNHQRKRQLDQF